MSSGIKFKIFLALVLSIFIAVLVFNFLKNYSTETTIVIATQDIDTRTWIKPEMLKEVNVRNHELSIFAPNAARTKKELVNAISKEKISVGQVIDVKKNVIAGDMEYLKAVHAVTEDGQINPSYFINDNRRIIAVRLDSQGSVNYILRPGDFVDVVFTAKVANQETSAVISKHIEIFDVEHIENAKNGQASQNILLLVTSQQSVDISLAKRTGKIDFVLNPEAGGDEMTSPANIPALLVQ